MTENINVAKNIDLILYYILRNPSWVNTTIVAIGRSIENEVYPMPENLPLSALIYLMENRRLISVKTIQGGTDDRNNIDCYHITQHGITLLLDGGMEKQVSDRQNDRRLQRRTNKVNIFSGIIQGLFVVITTTVIILSYSTSERANDIQEELRQTQARQLQIEELQYQLQLQDHQLLLKDHIIKENSKSQTGKPSIREK